MLSSKRLSYKAYVLSPRPAGEGEGPLHLSWHKKPLTPTLSQGERELACAVSQAITLILALIPGGRGHRAS